MTACVPWSLVAPRLKADEDEASWPSSWGEPLCGPAPRPSLHCCCLTELPARLPPALLLHCCSAAPPPSIVVPAAVARFFSSYLFRSSSHRDVSHLVPKLKEGWADRGGGGAPRGDDAGRESCPPAAAAPPGAAAAEVVPPLPEEAPPPAAPARLPK